MSDVGLKTCESWDKKCFKTCVSWDLTPPTSRSPYFNINNQQCFLQIDFIYTHNGYQNTVSVSISLNFIESYLVEDNLIVALYFDKKDSGYIFNLSKKISDQSFESNSTSGLISEPKVTAKSTCSVKAVIFHEKLNYFQSSSLVGSMKSMLKSEIHSDFQIKAGDKVFNVHKAVIAARSDMLKKMIENNMLEKKSSQVTLQADPIVVQVLLDYLYTDQCKISIVPAELFKLAHFLCIHELQMQCKQCMLKNINLKNIISILELTSYNDYDLKDLHIAAMEFVKKNEKNLIIDLEFQDFLSSNLKMETVSYILRLSYTHQLDSILQESMEFIRKNYQEVLKDEDFRNYVKREPDLSLLILQYCLDCSNAQSIDKK